MMYNFWKLNLIFQIKPKKFKRGIHFGDHLGVMYGAELFYLWIFFLAKPSKQVWIAFPAWTKSREHNGFRVVNYAVTIMCADRAEWSRQSQRCNNSHPYILPNMAVPLYR